jgi:ubiquinone/menaquinone biosynthesis C-methylase UbiE
MSRTAVNVSPARTAFDRVADSYDQLFTHSVIGRAQRKQVWSRLLAAFEPGQRILELNCGTGQDARFLAGQGRSIVACDASWAMIEVARRAVQRQAIPGSVRFLQLANEDLDLLPRRELFDGAFSNFSGLNCLSDLAPVAANLSELVSPGGNVLLCLWSRVCVSEVFWYLLHGQLRKAVRRLSGRATARIGELSILVSYPTVRAVQRAFSPWFELRRRRAVGLFVPPSYLEPSMSSHEKMLTIMEWLDRQCASWPILRGIGDHVLLEFTRCER